MQLLEIHFCLGKRKSLTASPIFLAIFESVIFAKGLSAPQHSTYFVILDDGLVLEGIPGVAVNRKLILLIGLKDKMRKMKRRLTYTRGLEIIKICN